MSKKSKENYLAIPNHIRNLCDLNNGDKMLLAHIYSFGEKGCWQSNQTLAEIFMTSPSTVSRRVAKLRKYLYVKSPKGYYRTMWAKSHPEVQAAVRLYYRGREIPKPDENSPLELGKNAEPAMRKCASDLSKSAIRPTQKRATTNNNTTRETIKETTAPPAPLPAGGQAPAVLADRKAQTLEKVEQFKQRFGLGKRCGPRLSSEQFDRERKRKLAALYSLAQSEQKQ